MPNPIETRALGSSGLKVSRLSLGTAPLGNLLREVSKKEALLTIEEALNSGINYLDTAPFYGYGLAEERISQCLQKLSQRPLISTKVGRLIRPGIREGNELYGDKQPFYLANLDKHFIFDFSYDGVLRSHEESLQRLGVEAVDILHIHDSDNHFTDAVEGAYRALNRLREEGSIKAVSAGMNQWEMLSQFLDHGDFDCFLLAGRYTLLDQSSLAELLPKCIKHGTSIVIGGVYNSGILANPVRGTTYNYVEAPQDLIDRVLAMEVVCQRHGISLKAAALQFPLGHPAVATVLTGVRSRVEWQENLQLFELEIPREFWLELREKGMMNPEAPLPGD
jgi:D-threo-aldose 1-dehydrogenase